MPEFIRKLYAEIREISALELSNGRFQAVGPKVFALLPDGHCCDQVQEDSKAEAFEISGSTHGEALRQVVRTSLPQDHERSVAQLLTVLEQGQSRSQLTRR
jgi:hypothetical protein